MRIARTRLNGSIGAVFRNVRVGLGLEKAGRRRGRPCAACNGVGGPRRAVELVIALPPCSSSCRTHEPIIVPLIAMGAGALLSLARARPTTHAKACRCCFGPGHSPEELEKRSDEGESVGSQAKSGWELGRDDWRRRKGEDKARIRFYSPSGSTGRLGRNDGRLSNE